MTLDAPLLLGETAMISSNGGFTWPVLVLAAFSGGALTAALFLTAAGQATLASYGLTSPVAASWVQAIGSIAAIAVGFMSVRWQVKRTRELEEEHRFADERRQLLAIWMAIYHCRRYMEALCRSSERSLPKKLPAELLRAVDQLVDVRVVDVFDLEAYACARRLIAVVPVMTAKLEKWSARADNAACVSECTEFFAFAHQEFRGAEQRMRKLLDDREISIPQRILLMDRATRRWVEPLPPESNSG